MDLLSFLRPARLLTGLALLLATAAVNPMQAAILFDFTGTCTSGCTGLATGTVSLIDTYVPGSNVLATDLLQFDFSSNSLSFTMAPPSFAGGGSILPGSTFFDISDGSFEFLNNNGAWTVSTYNGSAYVLTLAGDTGNFTASGVPEPSSMLLIGGGLTALGALRRRKR